MLNNLLNIAHIVPIHANGINLLNLFPINEKKLYSSSLFSYAFIIKKPDAIKKNSTPKFPY